MKNGTINIKKYELEANTHNKIQIPSNNKLLSVINNNDKIILYAVVDTKNDLEEYEFAICKADQFITFDIEEFNFLGTVKLFEKVDIKDHAYHVFYRKVL